MQEAEIEEDAEATRAVDWDKAAADEAYRAQVERAQERQRILLEQLAQEVGGPPASFCTVCPRSASAWMSWLRQGVSTTSGILNCTVCPQIASAW